jgi:galactokinase
VTNERIHVRAPGRVNIIGDHTDYTGGLVLPMAINRFMEIDGHRIDGRVELTSDSESHDVAFNLPVTGDVRQLNPSWGRYVSAVAAEMHDASIPTHGFAAHVTSNIPNGAGLSSSSALEVAAGLTLGFEDNAVELAKLCRIAELRASGVPCGIMDQLVIAAAVDKHALLIDCGTLQMTPVELPGDIDIVVLFVAHRTLAGSEYADRVAECTRAEAEIGPLRDATPALAASIGDPLIRRRARHVVSENQRVRDFTVALASGDLTGAGELMIDSHNSLRDDFGTSVPVMDAAVARLSGLDGVYGARMTGGGFGGCVVALADKGALSEGWIVHPVGGAALV